MAAKAELAPPKALWSAIAKSLAASFVAKPSPVNGMASTALAMSKANGSLVDAKLDFEVPEIS